MNQLSIGELKKMKKESEVRLNIRTPKSVYEKLNKVAWNKSMKPSALARHWIIEKLKEEEKKEENKWWEK